MKAWRLLREDGVSAGHGLAVDETLASRVVQGAPPTLRLYTYRPHSALIGRFQDAANEVHLAYCAAHGLEVNRRPTGGGAILMGPDQLGVALAVPGRGTELRPRALMERFSDGLVRALSSVGIVATFRGKNDLEVGGRKIAGLGVYRDPSGGLLFHASLLIDLDVALMAQVLKTPFGTITDAEIATVSSRTTTMRALSGRDLDVDDVRNRVSEGFARSFDVALEPGELDADEGAAITALRHAKYDTESWVHQTTDVPDTNGSATVATDNGQLDIHVALAGRTIKAVHLRGDFFETESAVADLEGRLRWHAARTDGIRATVSRWAEATPECSLDADALTRAIIAAAEAASAAEAERDPYGCFVTPEANHG